MNRMTSVVDHARRRQTERKTFPCSTWARQRGTRVFTGTFHLRPEGLAISS
jgi:hypothetical protein